MEWRMVGMDEGVRYGWGVGDIDGGKGHRWSGRYGWGIWVGTFGVRNIYPFRPSITFHIENQSFDLQ